MTRSGWARYFMDIALQVATRSTCDRKHVGCVLVVNHTIVATGYNGSPSKVPHCDDAGHELVTIGERESCVRTVHAEANAIIQAAKHGSRVEGAVCYSTTLPCYDCAKQLINAGVSSVIYGDMYQSRLSERTLELLAVAGVRLACITEVS